MAKVKQTAQWAVDAGMYVFVNTHHEADGNSGWISFPSSQSAAQGVAAEVAAVWTQIAKAFQSFNGQLMFECFNEPNEAGGGYTPTVATDLNMYLEACFQAIRSTGGANATRIVMIQPVGASPIQTGIQSIQKVSFINDPNLIISLHTYYPTNFGLSTNPYAWGSASDYSDMQRSIAQQIRVWLPTQAIVIGEWGSMGAQPAANRVAHALAYAQDTTTAALIPIWWDNGGLGQRLFRAVQPQQWGSEPVVDRQRNHDRCEERPLGPRHLGYAPLTGAAQMFCRRHHRFPSCVHPPGGPAAPRALYQDQELLSGDMQPLPDRVQRDSLNASDLLARKPVDLEQYQRHAAVRVQLREESGQDALVLLPLERSGRPRPMVGHVVHGVRVFSREDASDPGESPEITNLPLCDLVQPRGQMSAVERMQPAADHQEDVLGDVFSVRLPSPQRPDPAQHMFEPGVVEFGEGGAGRHGHDRRRRRVARPERAEGGGTSSHQSRDGDEDPNPWAKRVAGVTIENGVARQTSAAAHGCSIARSRRTGTCPNRR